MDQQLINVLLLSAAFHLILLSFQTSSFILQTVVNSIRLEHNSFKGDGYTSLCIVYAMFSMSNWLAPSLIGVTGAKKGMILCAVAYALYTASFLYPSTVLFYTAAALIGLGAGPLWAAQGSYLSKNSRPDTSSRNASIFWFILQLGMLFGNIFVYVTFSDQVVITDQTRNIVYGGLTLVCGAGALVLLLLPDCDRRSESDMRPDIDACGQFVAALKLSRTFRMILLSFAFLFTGVYNCFFTGVYGTAIGATSQFGIDAKKYIGLSGILIGIGEIAGGSVFGLMGKSLRRDRVFLLGYVLTMNALLLAYLNLPPDSSLNPKAQLAPIIEPKIWMVLLGSILMGFGDACFNTQIYSLLISAYSANSLAAFALFKFVQSVGSAVAFFYSTAFNLHHQLYLLFAIASLASWSYCYVDAKCRRLSANRVNPTQPEMSGDIRDNTMIIVKAK